jgi:hypothetical protein
MPGFARNSLTTMPAGKGVAVGVGVGVVVGLGV